MQSLKPEFKNYYQQLMVENPERQEDIRRGASELHKTAHPVLFPTLDELTAKGQAYREANQPGYGMTFVKGVARGAQGLAQGVGAVTRWGGDVIGSETISEIGRETSDYWKRAASQGWEKADTDTFQGTFMENPSLKRAVGIIGEAAPSLALGFGVGGAAVKGLQAVKAGVKAIQYGAPAIAGTALGVLEGGGTYEEAREKGKSIGEASLYGGLTTATTASLEALGIGKILGATGSPIRGAIVGGIAEGATEAGQTVAQNLIAKFGYDKTREWNRGLAESIIGGAGLGGPAGAISTQIDFNNKIVKDMISNGVRPQELSTMFEEIQGDLDRQKLPVDMEQYKPPVDPGAPQDMFDSGRQVEPVPAGNVGAVAPSEVTPYFGEKTEQELFMEQPMQAGFTPAESSAIVFEKDIARREQAEQHMQNLRQSPQGAVKLGEQLEQEQQAGIDWPKEPIQSGIMPAEESAAVFEAEERKRKRYADMTFAEQMADAREKIEAPEIKKPKDSKVRTLRGAIRANGGINFGNFKGELKNMSQSVKYLSNSNGTPIDAMEKTLIEEGWMLPEESLIDKLRDDPDFLRRPHLSKEAADKPQREKTEQELQIEQEQAFAPEEPPAGNYAKVYADELKVGDKITAIHGEGSRGWGEYTVGIDQTGDVVLKGDRTINLTPFDQVEVLQPEQRKDTGKRKRVSEMSPEELQTELLTDYKTGLGNQRAYDESVKKKHYTSVDVDGLKWVNDNLGHDVGDALIANVGEAFKQEGLESYHQSGDEYSAQSDSKEQLDKAMVIADNYLKANPIDVILPDGTQKTFTGSFSYGTAETIKEAEQALGEQKRERELSGERYTRGAEPTRFLKDRTEGDADQDRGQVSEDVVDIQADIDKVVKPDVKYSTDAITELGDRGSVSPNKPTYRGTGGVEFDRDLISSPTFFNELGDIIKGAHDSGLLADATKVVDGKPTPSKRLFNSMMSDVKFLGNVLETDAFRKKGFRGLDIKTQRSVLTRVGRLGKNLKIDESIVKLIPIDVVNYLRRKKLSPKALLNNPSMLKDALTSNLSEDIASSSDMASTFIKATALSAAKKQLGLAVSDSIGVLLNSDSAVGAVSSDHKKDYTLAHDQKQEEKLKKFKEPVTKKQLEDIPYVEKVTGKDGKYRLHFKNNISIPLHTVELRGEDAFILTPQGKKLIRGRFTPGDKIEISQAGDISVAAHENLHFFESIGLLSGKDIRLLNRAGEKMFGMEEDKAELRAKYFEAVSKTAKPDSLVGKILAKIKDFVTGMRQVFGRTAGGVIKDIETGKIFDKKNIKKDMLPKTTIPAYSEAADRWYSQMSKVIGEKLPGKGTGKNFLSTIESWVKKGSVKQEEFEWSGLDEFLKSKDNFTKAEVVDFLNENRVVIEEVEKIGPEKTKQRMYTVPNWEDSIIDKEEFEEHIDEFRDDWVDTETNELILDEGEDYTEQFISNWGDFFEDDFMDSLKEQNRVEPTDDTKYKQYQLPGGKNYKELLLTLPMQGAEKTALFDGSGEFQGYLEAEYPEAKTDKDKTTILRTLAKTGWTFKNETAETAEKKNYKSSHWDDPNVLAHVRFSEREVDGKKVLHIEEIQSDWIQEGRKKGFSPKNEQQIRNRILEIEQIGRKATPEQKQEWVDLKNKLEPKGVGKQPVPNAPWKKTWPIKTFQRMVRYATENGFDTIAWTPGEIQADRYDLSKSIGSLDYDTSDNTLTAKDVDNTRTVIQETVEQDKLDDYVGKEVADKIRQKANEQDLDEDDTITLSGLDLKVGGEGMKGFYDQILPKEVNKFFNKKAWGKAKVGEVEIEKPEAFVSETMDYGYVVKNSSNEYLAEGGWSKEQEDALIFDEKADANKKITDQFGKTTGVKLHSLEITPEMKSKSLSEGMPQFSTEDEYAQNFKESKNIKGNIARNLRQVKSEVALGLDKYLGAISTRLGNINPKLKYKMRKLSQDTDLKSSQGVKAVEPMLRKVKKNMTPIDTASWDLARKNSDTAKLDELIKKYSLESEYKAYRDTLDSIREEAIDVGLDVGYIEEYAPRILKDARGFLEAIGKEGDWPVISRRLQERAKAMGMTVAEMNEDQKADIISNMLHGGSYGLGGTAATKERKVKKISPELNKFYMDSDAALVSHIYSMRKAIEARKFFGKVPDHVAEAKKRLNAAQKEIANFDEITEKRNKEILLKIDNLESKKSLDNKQEKELERLNDALKYFQKNRSERLQDVKDNLYEYEQLVNRYANQRDFRENIGVYVNDLIEKKEISAADEQQLIDILTARFHEQGTRGLVQAYKNLSYIDTMGSVTSALTQIGDLAWAAYEGGMMPTLKNAYKASRGKSRITKEDVGVERVAQEFADAGTLGNAVSTVFKLVGLEKMDSIGKESLLNSALGKYQKQANKNPEKLKSDIKDIFEGETDSVIQDLQNDEITDNVKLLVYNRLLDFQPAALSEMPQKYLDAGNGRIFYMLKSFTLKQFDVFRNEIYKDLKSKDPKVKIEGMKKFVKLASYFVLANAGADELKDFVLGRKTDLDDRVVDNMLRLGGISKFVTWKARTEGVGSAMAKQILPPFKFLDAATKDIIKAGDEKGLETLASVPVIGKLAYWHMGRGVSKRGDLWDRRLAKKARKLKEVKDNIETAKNKREYRKENRKELAEYRKLMNFKKRINRLKRRINRLKSMEETKERKDAILKLEEKRTNMIKEFLQ